MGRPPCCDKSNVKRGLWTPEEDAKILAYVSDHGPGNWTSVPKKAGLRRCGKSCRLRYTNYLRPDLKHDNFTPQEEELIISLHSAIGSRWSLIAHNLPGRTDNDVKNHWNTKLKKKLMNVGIDPVTHKPISQILSDFENIGGLPKPATRMGTLNRDLKNAFMVKQEPQDGMLPMMIPMLSNEHVFDSPYNLNNNENNSRELLAQFQAIKLVTDQASNFRFNERSSLSPSHCSNLLQVNPQPPVEPDSRLSPIPATPSAPFCWSEFLLDDVFLQPNQDLNMLPSAGSLSQETAGSNNTDIMTPEGAKDMGCSTYNHYTSYAYPNNSAGVSSSSDSSFVEGILHRDSEMSWEFPSLLEEPYY